MILEIFLLLLTVYLLHFYLKPRGNLPPGPRGIPILGSWPYFYIKDCIKAKNKYGPIFIHRLGSMYTLYICDYKLAKEAFSKNDFANRPLFKSSEIFREEKEAGRTGGIIFSSGKLWLHNRRFALRRLRDLGMGKSQIEGIVMNETEELVKEFKKLTKEPSIIPFSLNIAILNIIWQLVASHRYDFEDRDVKEFMDKINQLQRSSFLESFPDLFPIVRSIIPPSVLTYLINKTKFHKAGEGFQSIVKPFIDEHLKSVDVNNPRDLMDDYLIEMKEGKSEDYSHFSTTDLARITFDLFVAGNDTTANMIRWVLIYMARFQEIQEKIQKEIDRVVPRDTLPGLQHRNELAYLDATINEVQRHCSMQAMGLFRYTTTDVKLGGYDIPKGTAAFSIAGITHKDPAYFKDPEEFNPSRFLDKDGKYIPTCDGFQAFGLGKRQCLGEQFARMELYLITAALLQNFTFAPPEGEGPMSIEPDSSPTVHFPRKQQKFNIKLRK